MSFVEAIAAKRDGVALDRSQIELMVEGASRGTLPPEQLAAMLMAICCRGMSRDETLWLTDAMRRSGDQWRLAEDRPDLVDKHSTGGVGDTVSLVLAPLLAAVGVPVAMMAGRGLGHTQGTLDKLAAIPGFRCDHDRMGVLRLVDDCGAAIVAQTADIAPADRTLYSLRDVTGTVPSLPLIVASIMSKKLALGAATLVLDVKCGSGAFRKTLADGLELASALREVARSSGVSCEAVLTDMSQPLGSALGTACEVRATLEVLSGAGDPRLRELTLRLAAEAMVLRGHDPGVARRRLERALGDGAARERWDRMVVAHGGDPDPGRMAEPAARHDVAAATSGVVTAIDGERLGWVAVEVGAGRRTRDEDLAHGAGVLLRARLGDRVEEGQPLATVLAGERPFDPARVVERVRGAFVIGDGPAVVQPLVHGTVDEVAASLTTG